ncbi:MAG TPA: ribosome maturation factor RimP [Propionicimonas sp.]|jgi:ribosome maturation factor RimP|uniref:ribosome maturation factor RimP n=1 Tax=Propionicimonas sp. TaxID=1955623 RepID=UPI002F423762
MNTADIESLVAPVVAAHSLEVDRIEVLAAGKRSVVRIFLDGDGPVGRGPSLDDIASATRAISAAFDDADPTRGRPYTLEVSSRGVTRPLTEARHFRRNTGRLVAIDTAAEQLTGRVLGVDDTAVEVDVDGQPRRVLLEDIRRAVVQIELNRPLEPEEEDEAAVEDEEEEEEG